MMNFTNLITKYQRQLTAKIVTGSYVRSKWTESTNEVKFLGTLLPLSSEDLQFADSGTYTTADKKLFVLNDLKDINGNALELKHKDIISDNVSEYELSQLTDAPEAVNYKKFICKKVAKDE
jgi:hypothetical protein